VIHDLFFGLKQTLVQDRKLRMMQRGQVFFLMALFLSTLSGTVHGSKAPTSGTFKGCPESGLPGKEAAENMLKNRSSAPPESQVKAMAVKEMLPDANANPPNQRATKMRRFSREQQGATVEGYLIAVRRSGTGSANCGMNELQNYVGWLAENPDDARTKAVQVEITPRWQDANPGWSLENLQRLAASRVKFKMTGWRMPQDPKSKASGWELHPVTKIEVFVGGQWVEQ